MKALAIATLLLIFCAAPATAHHVGTYTPRDNEVSANFKQLKFSLQARKFDVALRLFEQGALLKEMRAEAATQPRGLEEATRSALKAGNGPDAERALMIFFLALARSLALEADRQVGDAAATVEARAAAGQKFLEAIWRYYNLVDFALSQYDNKASVAMRLAFDDAEGYAKSATAPEKLRATLRRIAQILGGVIEVFSPSTRRQS